MQRADPMQRLYPASSAAAHMTSTPVSSRMPTSAASTAPSIWIANNVATVTSNRTTNNLVWTAAPHQVTNTVTTAVSNQAAYSASTAASNAMSSTASAATTNRATNTVSSALSNRVTNMVSTSASNGKSNSASNRAKNRASTAPSNRSKNSRMKNNSSNSTRANDRALTAASNRVKVEQWQSTSIPTINLESPPLPHLPAVNLESHFMPQNLEVRTVPIYSAENLQSLSFPHIPTANQENPLLHMPVLSPQSSVLPYYAADSFQSCPWSNVPHYPTENCTLPYLPTANLDTRLWPYQPVLNLQSTSLTPHYLTQNQPYPTENQQTYPLAYYTSANVETWPVLPMRAANENPYPLAHGFASPAVQPFGVNYPLTTHAPHSVYSHEPTRHSSRAAHYSHYVNPYMVPWRNPYPRGNVRRVSGSYACQHGSDTSTVGCPIFYNHNKPTTCCLYVCNISSQPLHYTYSWLCSLFYRYAGFRDVHILPGCLGAIVSFDSDYNTIIAKLSLDGVRVSDQYVLKLELVHSSIYSFIYLPGFNPDHFVLRFLT